MAAESKDLEAKVYNNTFNNKDTKVFLQTGANYGNLPIYNHNASDSGSNPVLIQAVENYGHVFNIPRPKAPEAKIKKINYEIPLDLPFSRNCNFAGRREELAVLNERFDKCFSASMGAGAPIICALTGTGGMGKTQLALEYAYTCRESRSLTAVFWMPAATEEAIRTSFVNVMQQIVEAQAKASFPESNPDYRAIGFSLGIPGLVDKEGKVSFDPKTIDDIRSALFGWFQLPGNSKWLLIFDNVDDLNFPIDKYFPTHGGGGVLVTSRRREFSHWGKQLNLGGLDKESAANLLLQLAQLPISTEEDQKNAMAVVKKLGFMPLAISHAGCFIHEMNIPAIEYLKYYDKAFKQAQSQVPEAGWDYRNDTAVTTWEVSFLAIQEQNKEAASLLLTCSYLSPNELLERLWEDEELDVDLQLQQKRKFSLLASYSLINRNQPGVFSVHPVVHDWARDRVDGEERFLVIRSALGVIRRALRRKELSRSSSDWDGGEERKIMAHAEVLCKYLDPEFLKHELRTSEEDTLGTVNNIALILYHQAKYDEALRQYQKILDWKKRVLGENNPETLVTVRLIASILGIQGKHSEALEQYQKIIASRKASTGQQFGYQGVNDDDLAALDTMHSMATALYHLGRYDEAFKQYQEVLAGKEKILGKDKSSTLITMNNMAAILQEQGKTDEALEQYQRVLASQERILQRDNPSILTTINNIATIFNKQGKYDEALKYHQRVLASREKVLDPDHPAIFSTIHDIAAVHYNQGKYTEALQWYQRALNGLERTMDWDHPSMLDTACQIASVFTIQGRYDEALKEYNKILPGQERSLGPNHSSTLRTIHSIGSVFNHQQRYNEALERFQVALAGREKVLGENHPDTLTTIHNIGMVLHSQGKHAEALQWFHRALAGREALDRDGVSTLDTVDRIALVLVNQGKYKEALKWCSRALAGRERTLGKDDPLTITSAKTAASCKKIVAEERCVIT
ncbi:hypothetical protein TWF281_005748 [Arthrobotrys megalospora]